MRRGMDFDKEVFQKALYSIVIYAISHCGMGDADGNDRRWRMGSGYQGRPFSRLGRSSWTIDTMGAIKYRCYLVSGGVVYSQNTVATCDFQTGSMGFIVVFTLAVSALLLHKMFPYSIWCISLGLVALPFVTLGWWLRSHTLPLWTKLLAIGCWILAIGVSYLGMYDFEWKIYPLDVVGACGGTYVLYLLSKLIDRHLKYVSKGLTYVHAWL